MLALITGGNGQLGKELAQAAPGKWRIAAPGREELDVRDQDRVLQFIEEDVPDLIINAAAYTAVDKAESEPELAYAVNADGAANLAAAARKHAVRLVHISTDFVFDGKKSSPYTSYDRPAPLGAYGAGKLEGEKMVLEKTGSAALVVRSAWLYSAHGHNFVRTMLRLLQEKDLLTVVADQVGTPTWCGSLAGALWKMVDLDMQGIHHYTDAGVASWYDFAVAIKEEALAAGELDRDVDIVPITTAQYPTPAQRPAYSVLDKTETWEKLGGPAAHWRTSLRRMLKSLQNG